MPGTYREPHIFATHESAVFTLVTAVRTLESRSAACRPSAQVVVFDQNLKKLPGATAATTLAYMVIRELSFSSGCRFRALNANERCLRPSWAANIPPQRCIAINPNDDIHAAVMEHFHAPGRGEAQSKVVRRRRQKKRVANEKPRWVPEMRGVAG